MSKAAPILATLGLSICLGLSPQHRNTATQETSASPPGLCAGNLFEPAELSHPEPER